MSSVCGRGRKILKAGEGVAGKMKARGSGNEQWRVRIRCPPSPTHILIVFHLLQSLNLPQGLVRNAVLQPP